jgi:hypothetical protein
MAEAKSATAKAAPVAPISPGGLQRGEKVGTPLTTNPPRGVDELPSDQVADEPAAAALQEHVKGIIDKETAQGYRGDPSKNRTPNSAYTLAGVGRGDPTPETTVHTPSSK